MRIVSFRCSSASLQHYLFDLNGFLVLKNALDVGHVEEMNTSIDKLRDISPMAWRENIHRPDHVESAGIELQNILEAGAPFEMLIDHPSWIDLVMEYVGAKGSFVEGVAIDENFATVREKGGFLAMHSGGHEGLLRTQYRHTMGKFCCGQVNILIALSDIGDGDGATVVVPASHKSNIPHPQLENQSFFERSDDKEKVSKIEGAKEVHLNKGDALLFTDSIMHGSALRTNEGERRVIVLRYSGIWAKNRWGYSFSKELLNRVTESRRRILEPIKPREQGQIIDTREKIREKV